MGKYGYMLLRDYRIVRKSSTTVNSLKSGKPIRIGFPTNILHGKFTI
jgi:hypothetical protein